jgi:hypothetical protein
VEPGDLVTLTHAMMGLSSQLVRVTSVEETDDGLAFEGIEWHSGVSVTEVGMPQTSDGIGSNPLVPPDSVTSRAGIAAMADDGIFSTAEHPAALTAWNDLNGSKADLVTKATAAGVSSTAWVAAWQALGTYLNGGTTYTSGVPAWLATPFADVVIVPATWQSTWAAAYTARVELLNAITADAHTRIADILSDGKLSPSEKPNFVSITNRLYWDLHAAWTSSWYNQWFGSPPAYTPYELLEMLLAYVGFDYRWFAIDAYWTGANIATQRGLLTAWLGSSTTIPDPAAFRTELDGYLSQAAAYQKALIDYLASGPGVMKALGKTGVTAVTGTPSSSTFLRGDGTWTTPAGGGTVTSVSGTSPVTSSGGSTPAIGISAATTSAPGSMSAADKTKLDAAASTNTASVIVMRDASGWIYCTDLSTSSDRRTKRKVRNLRGALARALGLRGVSFERRGDKTKAPRVGLIAQEVQQVLPEVVVADEKGMLSVSYGPIVALIIEALREIVKRLDRLEARK